MNTPVFVLGQVLKEVSTETRYVVAGIEEPKGGPFERRYILKLVGRWIFSPPLFITSLPESYVLENFTK